MFFYFVYDPKLYNIYIYMLITYILTIVVFLEF